MGKVIVLDSGPLGLLTNSLRFPITAAINQWVFDATTAGHKVIVPAVADYEVRRELERARKTAGILRLDVFNAAEQGRYLPLTDDAIKLAAKLWAEARQQGYPTAAPHELDADVLIAAQALTMSVAPTDLVVATVHMGHLGRYVTADTWTQIVP